MKRLVLLGSLLLIAISNSQCDQSRDCQKKIKEACHEPCNAPLTITRDAFGVPSIKGGTLDEVARAVGQVQAQDRLWQLFFFKIAANGRLAEFFGPGAEISPGVFAFVQSDIFQREFNYSDEEVLQQVATFFTPHTATVYNNFIAGLNDIVQQVNLNPALLPFEFAALGIFPVELFTLPEILRTNQFLNEQVTASSIPMYQLTNFSDLAILASNPQIGPLNALAIFSDVDPTTAQIKSQLTIVPNSDCAPLAQKQTFDSQKMKMGSDVSSLAQAAREMSKNYLATQEALHALGIPHSGSNGQALNGCKSASGNPLVRSAPQLALNFPNGLYQINIDSKSAGVKAAYTTIPTLPFGSFGVVNNFSIAVQTGHLPSNDFLFESNSNAFLRPTGPNPEIILVKGQPDIVLPIFRSTSGGWVIQPSLATDPTMMLTLRSVFLDNRLTGANSLVELFFVHNLKEFKTLFLNPQFQSDITLFEGEYADTEGNIAAFHMGGWTELPEQFDRRLPQGTPFTLTPSNELYTLANIGRSPLFDCNTKQGYYVAWNSVFSQGAPGSEDTVVGGIGLNRVYWLNEYIQAKGKLSFEDLKNITARQAVANNMRAFSSDTDFKADLFRPLFKELFFRAVLNSPNPTLPQLQAVAFLTDYDGTWLPGDVNAIVTGTDISDKFILAQLWLLIVMDTIFNPYLTGTSREIYEPTLANPLPDADAFLFAQNLLSRILGTACDNTVFFNGWLTNQPPVDDIIVSALDQALAILGGFGALPWGAGKRGIHEFDGQIPPLNPIQTMLTFNASGEYTVAELSKCGAIRDENIMPLGESGLILGPPVTFDPHCFDQQPLFTHFELKSVPPFDQVECALNKGICKKCGHPSPTGKCPCNK